MTKQLDEALKVLRGLPEDEQEKAARAIIDYGAHDDELQLTDEQVVEIERASPILIASLFRSLS